MNQTHWEPEISAIEARIATAPPHPIVFAGSSSIRLWLSLARDFSNHAVFNAGFGGSTMNEAADFASRIVVPLQPKQIVVFSGENDLAFGQSVDDIVSGFERFAQITAPTPILLLSIKPSPGRMEMRAQMEAVNARFKQICDADARLTFVDVWTPMLNDQAEPRTELWSGDGVHLARAGYKLWAETVRPHLI